MILVEEEFLGRRKLKYISNNSCSGGGCGQP